MPFEVEITPEGLRHLNRLPEKVRAAVVEAILGTIAENPHRAGKPLRGELEGLYSARRVTFGSSTRSTMTPRSCWCIAPNTGGRRIGLGDLLEHPDKAAPRV